MKRNPTKPGVYFNCVTCQWRHDVPAEHVAMVNGLPRSTYVPLHICPEGEADVEERGYFDAELLTTKPMHHVVIKL